MSELQEESKRRLVCHFHRLQNSIEREAKPTTQARACTILTEFGRAQAELLGTVVILTSGEAGAIDNIWLDEFHGLRISIRGHDGQWPISTIKLAQPG